VENGKANTKCVKDTGKQAGSKILVDLRTERGEKGGGSQEGGLGITSTGKKNGVKHRLSYKDLEGKKYEPKRRLA